MQTNRRWLKSAIAAASSEEIVLPWAKKRDMPRRSAQIIALPLPKPMPIAAATPRAAIAAR